MVIASAADVVHALWPAGSRLLDIGCGAGALVETLVAMGYRASGCDPQVQRVAEARRRVTGGLFAVAGAEALPYEDQSFDGCLMVHSLHHVPAGLMPRALAEAARCTTTGGYAVVIEPLPEGSFFAVLKLIDDETEARSAAQACLERAVRSGVLKRHAAYSWTRRQTFPDLAALLSSVAAADPARGERIAAAMPLLAAQFERSGSPAEGGFRFEQPIRCDVFKV